MRAGHILVGHPVDVGSGAVFTVHTDFRIPGSIELRWRRHYSTVAACNSWLGPKWSVPYFMNLKAQPDSYVLSGAHGEEVTFRITDRTFKVGGVLANFGANMELCREPHQYSILHWHEGGEINRFYFRGKAGPHLPLAAIESLAGHRISVEYDPESRPARIVQDLERRAIEISYDRNNLISAIHFLADGRRKTLVRYEYDRNRRLVLASDAMGYRRCYEYDEENRLIAETNPLGSRFEFQYDKLGRCIRTAGADGFLERKLKYLTAPRMTRVTDTRGARKEYYLNEAGQVIQAVDALGGVTTNTFDEHGRLTGIAHPDGANESFAYDNKGNRVAKVDSSGAQTAARHDKSHAPTKLIDANGYAWKLPDPSQGGLLGTENLPRKMWEYSWNALRLVQEARSPGGRAFQMRRDPKFGWEESHDQISLVTRTEYDEFGFPIRILDSAGLVSSTRYDDLHRPVEVTNGVSQVTRLKWNGIGRMVERVKPGNQRETWEYNQYGYLVAHNDSMGGSAIYEYDQEGRLVAITNRVSERLEYRRDILGRIVEEKAFDNRITRYEYNAAGRRSRISLSDGRTVDQRFDPAGRLIARIASDGRTEEFAYDKGGRLVKAWNNDTVIEIRRDRFNRIVAEIQNGRYIQYRYDADGNRIGRLLPFETVGCRVTRVFDLRGRLIALGDEKGYWQKLYYDHLDHLTERRCEGSLAEYFTYDRCDLLVAHEIRCRESRFVKRYAYDQSGNLASLDDTRNGTFHFAYDQLNRLLRVRKPKIPGAVDESYEYDANSAVRATDQGTRYVDHGGKVLRAGADEVTYGPDGAIASIQAGLSVWRFRHDVNGRLVEATKPDGLIIRYEYDPFGRRTARVVGDERTQFLWEGWTLSAEIKDEVVLNIYLWADLRPLARWRAGRRLTLVLDQRGAVTDVVDDFGDLRWSGSLNAYGKLISETGDVGNQFRLRGQYHDRETGLHYNFHRHYHPGLGDYTAPDPIGIAGGFHLYAYPRNPLRWNDPFGLECGDPEQHELPEEDPGQGFGGPAALADPPEDFPAGLPRLGPAEGQDIVDTIHDAYNQTANGALSTTTLTETEDGSLIVTNSDAVTPAMRDRIAEMQAPGGPLDGRPVLVPDDNGNPGYIPPGQRDLPPQGPNNTPTGAENHGEQRGIQAANYYDQNGDANEQGHGPAASQWSRSDAGHGGCACPNCAAAQQQNGVFNETGNQ
jgi:RHS repeat-associated protein